MSVGKKSQSIVVVSIKTCYQRFERSLPQEKLLLFAENVGVEGQVVNREVHPTLRRQATLPPGTRIVAHLLKNMALVQKMQVEVAPVVQGCRRRWMNRLFFKVLLHLWNSLSTNCPPRNGHQKGAETCIQAERN